MSKLYKVNAYAVVPHSDTSSQKNVIGTLIVEKKRFAAKEIKTNRYIRIYDDLNETSFKTELRVPLKDINQYGRSVFIKQSELIPQNLATPLDINVYYDGGELCIAHEINIDKSLKKQAKQFNKRKNK